MEYSDSITLDIPFCVIFYLFGQCQQVTDLSFSIGAESWEFWRSRALTEVAGVLSERIQIFSPSLTRRDHFNTCTCQVANTKQKTLVHGDQIARHLANSIHVCRTTRNFPLEKLRPLKHLLNYIREREADAHRLAALTAITEDLEANGISRGR